jgi:hypothetical protein
MMASCSSGPSSPSTTTTRSTVSSAAEGTASAAAIATNRVRLRRADGGDIATDLRNGQVIDAPVGVKLDIWAELTRLETDRARLSVDWGNGNNEITGCGSCRLENTYTKDGRYTVAVRVIDLNAATGSDVITSITVTLNVGDTSVKLVCDPVNENFDGLNGTMFSSYAFPEVSISSSGLGGFLFGGAAPPLSGGYMFSFYKTTFLFKSEKSHAVFPMIADTGTTTTYEARDAKGAIVASGAVSMTPLPSPPNSSGGILTVSGRPFRSIVLSNPTSTIYFDGVFASCR